MSGRRKNSGSEDGGGPAIARVLNKENVSDETSEWRQKILDNTLCVGSRLVSNYELVSSDKFVCPCPEKDGKIRKYICTLCRAFLLENQAANEVASLTTENKSLRDERESAILSAEVKFRKQFEKEAAKVKKDLAEYKDKALKAQDKINNLENKIRDLLKENKGLRTEIAHANSRFSNSEKTLAGVKEELGQVQVDYERSQKDLVACVKSGLIILNALPDRLAVGKVKKAGDEIVNTRVYLPYNIDDSYLLENAQAVLSANEDQPVEDGSIQNGQGAPGINTDDQNEVNPLVIKEEAVDMTLLENQVSLVVKTISRKIQDMNLLSEIKKMSFAEQLLNLECSFRWFFDEMVRTRSRPMYTTREYFLRVLKDFLKRAADGDYQRYPANLMQFVGFHDIYSGDSFGTIIVDPILEATDEYKKNVLIAEKRNAVKREFEKKAQKASTEAQASSTSLSQDFSPTGSENGRKRRHGLSSSEKSGSSESLFEGAMDDDKSEDEDRKPSKLKKKGRSGKKS